LRLSQNVGMGKKSSGPHTIASMEQVVAQLGDISGQIKAISMDAKLPPAIDQLDVPLEASLIDGLKFMQQWANSLRDAVAQAKLHQSRNGTVSASAAPVSDSPQEGHRPRRK
jgi:hypothetical protein